MTHDERTSASAASAEPMLSAVSTDALVFHAAKTGFLPGRAVVKIRY